MRIRRFVGVFFLVILLIGNSTGVLAYEGSGWVNEDPTTWSQLDTPSGELPLGRYNNGLSLASHGCVIHSATAMYIKYGARQRGYLPRDFREEGLKINSSGGQGGITENGFVMWGGVTIQSNGYFSQPESFTNPSKAQVQEWMKNNYGVIVEVLSKEKGDPDQTHWVLLDSLDGDDVRIVDSGWGKTRLSEWSLGYNAISIAWVYKPLKNADAPSLYKNKSNLSGSQTTNDSNSSITTSGSVQLSENEILGLANLPKGIQDIQDPNVGIFSEYPKRDQEAQLKAQFIREQVTHSQERNSMNLVRSLVSLVGWFVLFLGFVRLIVFVVDAKLGTNFYSYLNVGRKRAVDVGFGESNSLTGNTTISWKGGLITNIGLIITGFFILSGMFYSIILRFLV